MGWKASLRGGGGSGSLSWKGVYQDLRTLEVLRNASNIYPNFPEGDFGGVRDYTSTSSALYVRCITSECVVIQAQSPR
jgi:hypothetical protein